MAPIASSAKNDIYPIRKYTYLMHYLVTGGCGFIGSHLVHTLLEMGHKVTVIDDLSSGKRQNLLDSITPVIADITTPGIYDTLLEGIDGCFHLAAIVSVQRSHEEWLRSHLVNLGGLVSLFEAISRRKMDIPVVFASSAAIYGNYSQLPIKESAPCVPLSSYGVDKLSGESHARIASTIHGIPTVGLRFFNVYGPRQDASSIYSGVISVFTRLMKQHQPVTIYGDGTQLRDFVFVDDVIVALLTAMQKMENKGLQHAILNVCSGNMVSINNVASMIADITQSRSVIRQIPPRPGEVHTSVGDPALCKNMLGFEASTLLKDGLKRTIMEA